jgi:hypothetical protein
MRLTALLPTFALCLAPFASAQSSDQDLRAAIRKIVREEIQAALKDMHQPGMHQPVVVSGTVKGQPMMVVQDLPKDSFQWTTKAPKGKAGQKGKGAEGKGMIAVRLDDTEGHAETLGFGVNTVEGKPIKLELNKLIEGKLLAGKLLEGKALEGSTGNVQWRVVRDEDGEGEHKHEGGAHEVKGMTFHAGPGTMVLRTEGGEGQEGQSATDSPAQGPRNHRHRGCEGRRRVLRSREGSHGVLRSCQAGRVVLRSRQGSQVLRSHQGRRVLRR